MPIENEFMNNVLFPDVESNLTQQIKESKIIKVQEDKQETDAMLAHDQDLVNEYEAVVAEQTGVVMNLEKSLRDCKSHFKRINQQASTVLTLINDLLDLAKIE